MLKWIVPSREEFSILLFALIVLIFFKAFSNSLKDPLWSGTFTLLGSIIITKSQMLLHLFLSFWKKFLKKQTLEWIIYTTCSEIDLQKAKLILKDRNFQIDACDRNSLKSHKRGINISLIKSIDTLTGDTIIVEGRGNPRDLIEDYEKIFLPMLKDSCKAVSKVKLSLSFLSDELKEKVKQLFNATAVSYISADIEIGNLKASIENNTITVVSNSPEKLFMETQKLVLSIL